MMMGLAFWVSGRYNLVMLKINKIFVYFVAAFSISAFASGTQDKIDVGSDADSIHDSKEPGLQRNDQTNKTGPTNFVQLPATGQGYYTYGDESLRYGQPWVIDTIKKVAADLNFNMGVGFISQKNGQPMFFMKGMKTLNNRNQYRQGSEFALRYLFQDGDKPSGKAGSHRTKGYNRDATFKMLQKFIDAEPGKIREINTTDLALAKMLKEYAQEKQLDLNVQSLAQKYKKSEDSEDRFLIVRYAP